MIAAGDLQDDGTPVKVGLTSDTAKRLSALQTGNAATLVLVCGWDALDTGAGPALEAYLHDAFKEFRLRGEWFESTPRLRALIHDMREDLFETLQALEREKDLAT